MSADLRKGLSASLRKGWCPGALRPMAARDGLIVRLRITGGIVPAATACALADLAERHGNGRFDLSARANLQIRGVREAEIPTLHDSLRALGLLDRDAEAEAVRNVVASPLAGLQDGLDIRPLVAALEARLAGDPLLHALPGKFGFLVDDGGMPSLADIVADVRFEWIAADAAFAIGLGGARDDCVRVGTCPPEALVDHAAAIARGAITLGRLATAGHRMRDLVAGFGAEAVAQACGGTLDAAPGSTFQRDAHHAVGLFEVRGLPVLGLVAPFGRVDAAMLRQAADAAAGTTLGELRLTPWRSLLVPAVLPDDVPRLDTDGFIVDPSDPRLNVTACVGAPECARATTPTRADATALAAVLDANGGSLHVSGCEKGCAKPSASTITLVGREGRYDLVVNGNAADVPARRALDLDRVRAAIAELLG